ncbi:MAG: LysE family translocator [Saprospiraceae bacterium]
MFLKGILLGLSLSFMVGPLLFAIVYASLERGFRAGLALAAGIWSSDMLYLSMLYFGIEQMDNLTRVPHFRFWASMAGGLVLLAFGAGILLKKAPPVVDLHNAPGDRVLDRLDGPELEGVKHNWQTWGLGGYWLRGFLINLINPFTMFFWLGIAGAVIIPEGWNSPQILRFFGGMFGALIILDTAKAYAARKVRQWLTPSHVARVQRIIGLALLLFGLFISGQAFYVGY